METCLSQKQVLKAGTQAWVGLSASAGMRREEGKEGGKGGHQGEPQGQRFEAKFRSWRELERTEQDSCGDKFGPWDFEGGTPGRLAGRGLGSMASCRLLQVWTVFQEGLDPRDEMLSYHTKLGSPVFPMTQRAGH